MSNAIGVGAHTVTTDDFVVLMERAAWTGEGAGKVDRPGGHPEPEIVQKVSGCCGNIKLSALALAGTLPKHSG